MSAEPVAALSAGMLGMRRKKRRPLIALLLSLLCPGLGQLYASRVTRSLRMLGIGLLLMLGAMIALIAPPTSAPRVAAGFGLVAVLVAFQIGTAIDAYRVARRAGVVALTRANRLWVYVAILTAWVVVPEVGAPLWSWKSYKIPAASMLPTLPVGDHFIAWRGYFAGRAPQPGDLAVFKLPRDNATDYIKRIVGLPGQRIQMRAGRLYIDDALVPRERLRALDADPARDLRSPAIEYLETLPNGVSYRILEIVDDGPLDETPVHVVPPNHVFVLGDNRDNSLDSRTLTGVGFVPVANLRDRPGVIFWSRELGRIGRTLR